MDEKLQEALKKANAEVEKAEITDPELKKVAFSKAVDFYLYAESNQASAGHKVSRATQDKPGDFWISLANSTGVEAGKLKDIYSLKGEQVLLVISSVPGDSKADKQRNLAALVLLAYQDGLNREWVSSQLLAEAAKHSRLYDTSKFSKNLVKYDWFRSEGASKGLKYKLSGPGVSEARNAIKALAN